VNWEKIDKQTCVPSARAMAPPSRRKTSQGNFFFIDFQVKMVGAIFIFPSSLDSVLVDHNRLGQMKKRKEIRIAGVASVT
jgi:hypothetical protein